MQSQEALASRIRGEYREMPGLSLTVPQACRLWNLDGTVCEGVLQVLLDEGFLARRAVGQFAAYSAEHVRPARTVVTSDMIRRESPRDTRTASALVWTAIQT
jgi:hypothetical protein